MIKSLLFLTVPSLVVLFLVLELTVRFIIPASQFPYYYFDPDERILRFSTTDQRDGVFTIGPLAQQRARWHINNRGWNSAIDFTSSKTKTRVAVIGDSYIEALQVDIDRSIAGQLRQLTGPSVDIYAFGISGAPLSQYLQMARYVRRYFDPDVLVINVVHNDFDESLCSVNRRAGMLCLLDENGTIREADILPYQPDRASRMARRSSLVRFAVANLQLNARLSRLMSGGGAIPHYNANIDVAQVRAQKDRVQSATEYVLRTLKRESGATPIVFLMDAPRRDIYDGNVSTSDVLWLHQMMENHSERMGLHFVDLTEEFARRFQVDHVGFESDYDWHWNERGHQTAAMVLERQLRALGVI